MSASFSWMYSPAWRPLVYALLHTLWQGAVVGGGLVVALRLVPVRRANLRYGFAVAALTLVLLAGIGSWAVLDTTAPRLPGVGKSMPPRLPRTGAPDAPEMPGGFPPAAPVPDKRQQPLRAPAANLAGVGIKNPTQTQAWVHLVAAFWLLGVAASLLRAVKNASGAGRLRRRCQTLTDPGILALTDELRARLRLSRRVRFLVSAEFGVPSVLGILWPAVLLPASMLTGVPAEQLRAILAHELAHVRRWDYLINLGQMLVEALLFFNPFVWWISRQVRVEREACCDQLAARECQSPANYVEALVTVIERSRPVFAPVLAASGLNPQGGAALDRARRLLVPGYQPALRLRWFSLALVLTLSGLALAGLRLGTSAVAQTIQQAEQKTAPKQADYPSTGTRTELLRSRFQEDRGAAYHIKVTMADGSPLGSNVVIHNHDQLLGAGSWSDSNAGPDGSATVNVQAHTLTFTLAATKPGYAALYSAPFTPQNMDHLEGLELKLARGYTAVVQTVDEAGNPLAGASLTGVYPGPPELKFGEVKTDASGAATFEHLGEAPLTLHVLANGYQADAIKSVHLDPAKPYRWTLKKTSLVHGKVTASATGQPISGAVVRLAYVRGQADENYLWPGSGPVLATTDEQGRFTLGSLRADSRYWLGVDAPGYGGVFLGVVTLARPELNVELGPKLMVRGKVIHIPPALLDHGRLNLGFSQTFSLDKSNAGIADGDMDLTPVNGEAAFEIGPFYKASGLDSEWNGTMEYARNTVTLWVKPSVSLTYESTDLPLSNLIVTLGGEGEDAQDFSSQAKPAGKADQTVIPGSFNQIVQALQDSAAKITASSPSLKILQGYFGADGSWRDVTEVLRNSVRQDALEILWQQPYSIIGGDPAFGKIKTLVVSYQIDGKSSIATFQEDNAGLKATLPTASGAPVVSALPYKVTATPKSKKAFPRGEGIEVQDVAGTTTDFQVGGTYQVSGVCRQHTLTNATLYLGNTAEPGPDAIAASAGSSLYQPLPKGSTEFSFTFKLLRAGVLHLTVYDLDNHDKNDNAHGGIFLGKVDEVP